MIIIKEDKPKKCPGLTSLFLEFEYKQEIIDVIKKCQLPLWDKKEKKWEVPTSNLSYLLDQLTLIDDIQLELYHQKEKPYIYYKHCEENFKVIPFKHQLEAVEYGLNHDKWLLLDSPGLGKSLSITLLAQELYRQKKIEKCLIICGINSLKRNWEREIKKFSNLSCRIIGQHITKKGNVTTKSIPDRVKELSQPLNEFFIILNIENLRSEDILKAINSGPNKYGLIAFDEIHKSKDPSSQSGKYLFQLKSQYKVAATGTLLLNSPLDAYMALKWIGAEQSTYSNFKYYYCQYGGPFNNVLEGFRNTETLKDQIDKYSLRRTKDILDLPPKNIIEEYVELDEKQRIFYENVVQGIVHDVKEGIQLKPDNLLAMTTRLRQAIDCPQVLTNEEIPNVKIDRCIDLAEQILSDPNEKLAIFSCFKEPCKQLFTLLKDYNPLICTGDTSDDLVDQYKEMFQNDNEHRVMICTGQKMGTGHTLNRAHYSIFIDTPYTAAVLEQWEDRVHRIGTKDPVFIYHLWALDTFDMRVKELVDMKGAISDYIVDGVTEAHLNILKRYIEELR